MDEVSKENQNEKKTLDIFPLSKWKRILVYLCDLIICFFAAFFIMNVMALPIGKAASNHDARITESDAATKKCLDMLYESKLLFYENKDDKYHFNENFEYTSYIYVKQFVFDENPNYQEFDPVRNYYKGYKGNENAYINILQERDKDFHFFDFEEGKASLKQVYKDGFAANFIEGDKMGETAHEQYLSFKENIFLPCYTIMHKDIIDHDLLIGNDSYNSIHKTIEVVDKYIDNLAIICAFSSLILSVAIWYLIIPLCNKNGKTVAMFMMRIERVGVDNIYLLKKSETAIISIYHLLTALGVILFVPVPFFMLYEVFRLPPIIITAGLSFLLTLASFIFLLFNKFNRTLFDFLSRSVMITSDSLDDIYRSKGYVI